MNLIGPAFCGWSQYLSFICSLVLSTRSVMCWISDGQNYQELRTDFISGLIKKQNFKDKVTGIKVSMAQRARSFLIRNWDYWGALFHTVSEIFCFSSIQLIAFDMHVLAKSCLHLTKMRLKTLETFGVPSK